MKARKQTLEAIARKHLLCRTLKTQNSDRLDFHSVSVASIEAALQEAYQKGFVAGEKNGIDIGYENCMIATGLSKGL